MQSSINRSWKLLKFELQPFQTDVYFHNFYLLLHITAISVLLCSNILCLYCERNREASQYLMHITRVYDLRVTQECVINLQIVTEALYELPNLLVLYTGLELICRKRQVKKAISVYETRGLMEAVLHFLNNAPPL